MLFLALAFAFANAAPDLSLTSDALLFRDHAGIEELRGYLQSRSASPLAPRARLLLGLNLLRRGDAEGAIEPLQNTLGQLSEIDDFVSYELGEAYFQAKKIEPAYKVFNKLVSSHPDADFAPLAEERLAQIDFTRGDATHAFELTNHLLSEGGDDGRSVRILMLQGEWLVSQGKKSDALKLYKRVWIEYPEFDESEKARGYMKRIAGELSVSADPTVDEMLARGKELYLLGRDEESDALLLQVLSEHRKELDPKKRALVLLRRAHSASRRKTPEIALELVNQLLGEAYAKGNIDFRHEVMRLQAKTVAQLLDFKRSADIYQQLVHEAQKHTEKRDLMLLEGVVRRDAGDVPAALKTFADFVQQFGGDPKVYDARWFWGWTLFRSGDYPGAQKEWKPILDHSPQGALSTRIYYWTGRASEIQGHKDAAASSYEKVATDEPWSYYGWLARERLAALRGTPPQPPAPDSKLDALVDGTLPFGNKNFIRASLFWQLGLFDLAARSLRAVPVPESNTDALLLAQLHDLLGDDYRSAQIVRGRFASDMKSSAPDPVVLALTYPRAYRDFVEVNARRFSVPPELVWSIMRQESTFRQLAVSSMNAQGLLQLMPRTAQRVARDMGEPPPPTFVAPELNIHLGTAYLSRLYDSFYRHPALAAAAYNGGPLAVDHWLLRLRDLPFDVFVEEIPFRETRDYVKKVMANYAAYRRIYLHASTVPDTEFGALPQASKGLVDF